MASSRTASNVEAYGRLLRYVVRARDGVNINLRLVAVGAAAPYFYRGRRGRYANRLEALAGRARAKHLGLWGACPHTVYDPYLQDDEVMKLAPDTISWRGAVYWAVEAASEPNLSN